MAKTYSLFISHSWDHNDVSQDLKSLLNSRDYFPAEYTQIEKDCPLIQSGQLLLKLILLNVLNNQTLCWP